MIDLRGVDKCLNEIKKLAKADPESAHSHEDSLHQDVLQAIADGCPEPERLARAALRTLKMKFPRWCA